MSVPMEETFSASSSRSVEPKSESLPVTPAAFTSGSPLLRFFDSFLQERNIRWMLGLGMLILFGSSLTLVRTHWGALSPVGRHLILLSYTGVIGALGQWAYRRLGLRITGTVLHALTVLLIPLTFVAWHLMRSNVTASPPWYVDAGLLIVNLVGAALGAHYIFRHLLRGTQTTFLVCYLLLAMAGAVVPGLPVEWWPVTGLALWGAFAVGTVKVNRHVFWITEERRLPRIFGFFPIALLGTQFLLLTGFLLVPTIWSTQRDWLGLACLLTAVPVLLTADTVARVFEQRTGNLVRPLPWSIVLPLFTGLALCFAGLGMSAMGLPFPKPLVPTAALFAAMMAIAARRTNKAVFVWFALIGLTLSYNFSFTFFRDVAKQLIKSGAAAIHEERLPIAYYGLTYLPLLTLLSLTGGRLARRGQRLFAHPIEKFVIGLTCLLQLAACTHIKAVFPVSLALVPVFVLQAICFRNRLLLMPALLSFFVASFGFAPYLETVQMQKLAFDSWLVWPGIAAGLLLVFGRPLDRLAARIPVAGFLTECDAPKRTTRHFETSGAFSGRFLSHVIGPNPGLCRHASWIVTLLISAAWCAQAVLHGTPDWLAQTRVSELFIFGLLVVQALVWKNDGLGTASLGFAGFGFVLHWLMTGVSPLWVCVYATPVLIGLWCVAALLKAYRIPRLSAAYGWGSEYASAMGLALLLSMFYLFDLTTSTMHEASWHRAFQGLSQSHVLLLWGCRLAIVAWAFDAARVYRQGTLSCLGAAGILGIVSAMLTERYGTSISWQWFPLGWTLAAVGLMAVLIPIARRQQVLEDSGELTDGLKLHVDRLRALTAPLDTLIPTLLLLIGAYSIIVLQAPVQVAGGIAAASLLWLAIRIRNADLIRLTSVLLNWQVILLVVRLCSSGHKFNTILDLRPAGLFQHQVVLLLALVCVASARLWSRYLNRLSSAMTTSDATGHVSTTLIRSVTWQSQLAEGRLIPLHVCILNVLTAFLLMLSFGYRFSRNWHDLPLHEIVALMMTYGLLITGQIRSAINQKSEAGVWRAEGLVACMLVHMIIFGTIQFGMGTAVYVLMGTGFALWSIGWSVRDHKEYSVLSRPFQKTGFALPLVAVLWAMARRVLPFGPHNLAVESITLLLPAAFYFWRGLEERNKTLTVFAVGLFNLTLALLWHDLNWHDPQLYLMPIGLSVLALVEILSAEIPQRYHSPLRYVGALFILVSPTFSIVQESWLHITTLMVAALLVSLLGIGLRIRPFLYCGAAFLIADLVAMVVLGAMHDRTVLWASGVVVGTLVLLLGAYFEKRREHLLQRLRILSSQLETWK